MKNLTLKQYLLLNEINYEDIKTLTPWTIWNIIKGSHTWDKYNERYKGNKPYYPTEKTIEKLAKGLDISIEKTKKLIDNQFKKK